MLSLRSKLFSLYTCAALTCIAFVSGGCRNRDYNAEQTSGSQTESMADVDTIKNLGNGIYRVFCLDGSHKDHSLKDIKIENVCLGNGGMRPPARPQPENNICESKLDDATKFCTRPDQGMTSRQRRDCIMTDLHNAVTSPSMDPKVASACIVLYVDIKNKCVEVSHDVDEDMVTCMKLRAQQNKNYNWTIPGSQYEGRACTGVTNNGYKYPDGGGCTPNGYCWGPGGGCTPNGYCWEPGGGCTANGYCWKAGGSCTANGYCTNKDDDTNSYKCVE